MVAKIIASEKAPPQWSPFSPKNSTAAEGDNTIFYTQGEVFYNIKFSSFRNADGSHTTYFWIWNFDEMMHVHSRQSLGTTNYETLTFRCSLRKVTIARSGYFQIYYSKSPIKKGTRRKTVIIIRSFVARYVISRMFVLDYPTCTWKSSSQVSVSREHTSSKYYIVFISSYYTNSPPPLHFPTSCTSVDFITKCGTRIWVHYVQKKKNYTPSKSES